MTSVASTPVASLKIGADNQWSGGAIPVVNLKATGAGSWSVNGALGWSTDDLQTVGAGLNVVATDAASAQAAKLYSSHATLALMRLRAMGTTNAAGVEWGASGNNVIERVNGASVREVSAADLSHDLKSNILKNFENDFLVVASSFTYNRAAHLSRHVIADNTAAAITATLPSEAKAGDFFWLNRYRVNNVNVTPAAGATLNLGTVSINPTRYGWMLVQCVRNTGGSVAEWIMG